MTRVPNQRCQGTLTGHIHDAAAELEQQLRELDQELKQQQYKLEQEIRERAQRQLAAKDAEFMVHNRTTELLVLKGCMNLRGILEFVENEAKKSGAPNQNRFGLWKWILKQKPDLQSCIKTATSLKNPISLAKSNLSVTP